MSRKDYYMSGGELSLKKEKAEELFELFKEAFPLSLACGTTKEVEFAMKYVVVNFHPDWRQGGKS